MSSLEEMIAEPKGRNYYCNAAKAEAERMDAEQQTHPGSTRPIPAILWPIVLGGVGFLAGFIGPVTFNPDANQGPLFGIFISGPGGVVLGLLLYVLCRWFKVTTKAQVGVMGLSAVIFALATLSLCFPSPELRGYVVEVQLEKCQPPSQVMDAAIDYWNGRIAKVTWAAPRAGWQEQARVKANGAEGVVLDVTIAREKRIYLNHKPWNNGALTADGWAGKNSQKSYYADYAGSSCADYPVGKKATMFSAYDVTGMSRGAGDWPPQNIAVFLNRAVLENVPEEYRDVVSR